ncbi:hypothetical protein QE381_002367 [Microbacterium sp. SORGH_AS 888]|nr:hypothetical protein [Microbacterium sp. SORGH_AS_0888]
MTVSELRRLATTEGVSPGLMYRRLTGEGGLA